ncbi:MAG: hypothetical protein J0I19_17375 [Alphaproteobacteria bacterium]|nr:hypothetical protein [Alphaproteobacteria bacterium]
MTGLLLGKCNSCDALILDEVEDDRQDYVVCKGCGAKVPAISERGNVMSGSAWDPTKSKSKGLLFKQRLAFGVQHNRSRLPIRHERLIDKHNNRYVEKVTARNSGEIIHECDEPLSDHKGHGSDKKPTR